jgi:acetylornithine deacetylase
VAPYGAAVHEEPCGNLRKVLAVACYYRAKQEHASAAAFGTEGPYFRQLGMDALIYGPGDIEQAHQPDEFIRLDSIAPTVAVLRGLIREFCVA